MSGDPVLVKVQKLLRLSKSSNANEAALAAAKAQELIDRHQLSAALLALDEATPTKGLDDEPIVNFDDAPLDTPKQIDRWRGWLAVEVCRANACKAWVEGSTLKIVGRPSDAESARYVYGWLSREVERLATEHGAGKGRTWRNNFRLGVVETIAKKLKAQREQTIEDFRAEAVTAGAETGDGATALMRVNHAIAKVEDRRMDVYRWVKANMKLTARGGSDGAYHATARESGRKAGESLRVGGDRHRIVSAAKGLPSGGVQ